MRDIDFYGLKLTSFDNVELIEYSIQIINSASSKVLYGYSFTIIPLFGEYPSLYSYANNSDIIVCDGAVFYRFVKVLGYNLKSNLSIPEMVRLHIKIANTQKYSIYLLGATKQINKLARDKLKEHFPNIIVNGRDGYFKEEKQDEIMDSIKIIQPNIILIGITTPKKEELAILLREKGCGNIIIPCGGMIDVLAGKTKQTPKLIKRLGLATFYRLVQEPNRLMTRYLKAIIQIFLKIIPRIIYAHLTKNDRFFIPDLYNKERCK